MRTLLLVLLVFGVAIVGADAAMAQDPCQPYCDDPTTAAAGAGLAAAAAPAIAAVAGLAVAAHARGPGGGGRR
jgi:hypothetical protein